MRQFLVILHKFGHSFTLAEYVMHRKIQSPRASLERGMEDSWEQVRCANEWMMKR